MDDDRVSCKCFMYPPFTQAVIPMVGERFLPPVLGPVEVQSLDKFNNLQGDTFWGVVTPVLIFAVIERTASYLWYNLWCPLFWS